MSRFFSKARSDLFLYGDQILEAGPPNFLFPPSLPPPLNPWGSHLPRIQKRSARMRFCDRVQFLTDCDRTEEKGAVGDALLEVSHRAVGVHDCAKRRRRRRSGQGNQRAEEEVRAAYSDCPLRISVS